MNALNFKPPKGMKLRHGHWLWLWFLLSVIIILVLWDCIPRLHSVEILVALLTSAWGVFYFLNQQHLKKARFFKELVTEFNQRYDAQNNKLLTILKTSEPLYEEQKQSLIDYFNLCAEEYLFYEAGYIDNRVWDSWYNGMKQFGRDHRVSELWQQEIQTNSYYEFEFPNA